MSIRILSPGLLWPKATFSNQGMFGKDRIREAQSK